MVVVFFLFSLFCNSFGVDLLRRPYDNKALEPFISEKTSSIHYNKHHGGYVKKLNKIIKDTNDMNDDITTIDIIKNSDKYSKKVVNLASQIFNHEFYWNCLTPDSDKYPISDKLINLINKSFKSFDNFKKVFSTKAKSHFGSGWIWLVVNKDTNKLEIIEGHDAFTPLSDTLIPMLTVDVWEHAYYLSFQNDRGAYVDMFWGYVNWNFVQSNLFFLKRDL